MHGYLKKLESLIEGWLAKVPHLPKNAQDWLAKNVWWVALIGAIAYGITVLVALGAISYLGAPAPNYTYFVPGYAAWSVTFALIQVLFSVVVGGLLAFAVQPLRAQTKKGWTLLFFVLLVGIVELVVNSLLGFVRAVTFGGAGIFALSDLLFTLLFGAIFAAVAAYFLFQIRSHFAHVTKGAKKKS